MKKFSAIPDWCPSCEGKVVKKVCQDCRNVFGLGIKDRRKKSRSFPSFSREDIDNLRKKEPPNAGRS